MQDQEQLKTIENAAWQLLQQGSASRHHGCHLPILATTDEAGNPDARIVVLRRVDAENRCLTCHTDARAPKVDHIKQHAFAAWVFYNAADQIQVRVSGRTQVLEPATDALALASWNQSALTSRRCYLAPHAPSSVTEFPTPNLPSNMLARIPTQEESEAGITNFRVIKTDVQQLEYLHLAHDGHHRARFVYQADGSVASDWLAP